VQVASTIQHLGAGQFDLWDSGRIDSSESFDIHYDGAPLSSRQQAHWRVIVWDNHGCRATSAAARWEMGLLSAADWHADWLAAETDTMQADREVGLAWLRGDGVPDGGRPRLFRLSFALPESADVTLFTIAGSRYQAWLDGTSIALPDFSPNAFGRQGTIASRLSLPAGDHVLGLSVEPLPEGTLVFGNAGLRCAMLVRAQLPEGRTLRFDGRMALTSADDVPGWAKPEYGARAWTKVIEEDRGAAALPGEGAFLLRREFKLQRAISAARLYVTALGAYEIHLNGQRVADDQLAPEFTDFSKRVMYRVHDVTALVSRGDNAVGAIVGDGWYGSYLAPIGRFGFGPGPLRLIVQLEVRYGDGETEIVTTDEQWQISRAPITMSEIYDGEDYDARLEQAGWANAGFAPGLPWSSTRKAVAAPGRLVGMFSPPIRRIELLSALSITRLDGSFVVDFGQNFAGWARIRVTGRSGDRVTLRFAEVLKSDGRIDQSNLRAARAWSSIRTCRRRGASTSTTR
jgi:alpha-L-rhamnosidase